MGKVRLGKFNKWGYKNSFSKGELAQELVYINEDYDNLEKQLKKKQDVIDKADNYIQENCYEYYDSYSDQKYYIFENKKELLDILKEVKQMGYTIVGNDISLGKRILFNVDKDIIELIHYLEQENEGLKKQLDYIRSGEYFNQLRFERDMLQDLVDYEKISEEDKNFIDMTHRNTELLEENEELKKQLEELKIHNEIIGGVEYENTKN